MDKYYGILTAHSPETGQESFRLRVQPVPSISRSNEPAERRSMDTLAYLLLRQRQQEKQQAAQAISNDA